MASEVYVSVRTAFLPAGIPVQNVKVAMYNSNGAFVQSDTSNEAGSTYFGLRSAGTYELRLSFPVAGRTATGNSRVNIQVGGVDATEIFDVLVDVTSLPAASNDLFCRCSGRFVDLTGIPVAGEVFTFSEDNSAPALLLDSGTGRSAGVVPRATMVCTGRDGQISVDLLRGQRYHVSQSSRGHISWTVVVPEQAAASFPDVVFPAPEVVEYRLSGELLAPSDFPVVAVNQGSYVLLDVTTVFRSGARFAGLRGVCLQSDANYWKLSAAANGGELRITGLSPGEATLNVVAYQQETGYGFRLLPTTEILGSLVVTVVDDPDVPDVDPPAGADDEAPPPFLVDGGII